MTISLSFSVFIYQSVNLEFQRRLGLIERRLQLRQLGFHPPPGEIELFIEDINDAKERVFLILFYTNIVILSISALSGWLLAGKTLEPIEATVEEQKRFISDASHELKTPLTALKTSIEVALRDKKLNLKAAKETLNENLDDIEQLKNLANDLLSLTRYEHNGNGLIYEKLDFKDVFEKVNKIFSLLSKEKNIKVTFLTKNAIFKGHKESIEKMFSILLDNAIKYTEKNGSVTLATIKNGNNISLTIKDTGVGISKTDLPHIFDRFYRVDPSRSKVNVTGFGLGLSIAKRIVEIHKGSIFVSSAVGKGTSFTITLPINP